MPEREVDFSELHSVVQKLHGLKAWRSRAGNCTGSVFTLEFGARLAEAPERGAYGIMAHCSWRVSRGVDIVCTWHQDPDSKLAPGLELLHGGIVQNVALSGWGDLRLEFDNGFALHLFADLSEENDINWFIANGRTCYSWSTDFTVLVEEN